jgi:hypothetical protein
MRMVTAIRIFALLGVASCFSTTSGVEQNAFKTLFCYFVYLIDDIRDASIFCKNQAVKLATD